MIIARAPLRISLIGGGSDLPAYADRFGGFAVSVAINRYVYALLMETTADSLQIHATDARPMASWRGQPFDQTHIENDRQRLLHATFAHFEIKGGYRAFLTPELPAGLGLGSSGATTVGLIAAITAAQQRSLGPGAVAELACQLAIEQLDLPFGRQDQYAAAFGGLNALTFERGETHVDPCPLSEVIYRGLEERLLLFITGLRGHPTRLLLAQRDALRRVDSPTLSALHDIKALAQAFRAALCVGDFAALGDLLDRSWQRKRCLAPGVSNAAIDTWYSEAKLAGARGGKISGPGGGGSLLLYAEPEARRSVIARMQDFGLTWVDIALERGGTTAVLMRPEQTLAI